MRAGVLRALAFSILFLGIFSHSRAVPLPDHRAICVDTSRNRLLWSVVYGGATEINLSYSALTNAYQYPAGIDTTQPRHFFPNRAVYFWAPIDKELSNHRWVLAGNAKTVRPASLSECNIALHGECVGGVYDYCSPGSTDSFCYPISCNVLTNACEAQAIACPADKPICVEALRACVACTRSFDCQQHNPISFCEGGWHCALDDHTCQRTPPPCDADQAECDPLLRTCRKFACSSHADCDDGNPCNGREICDFSLRTCYMDPTVDIPCNGERELCDGVSGKCHECVSDADCEQENASLFPCEPRKGCGADPVFPSHRVCETRPPVVECEDGMHCDNIDGSCVACVHDENCYPPEVRSGARPLRHCDGEFYCHAHECVHYARCMDETSPFCIESTKICSACMRDEHCDHTKSFCRPSNFCNIKSGKCESLGDQCGSKIVTLDNGNDAEMPTVCDEGTRSCIQSVLCLDDSHCRAATFCSRGERCNLYTGLCELDLLDTNGSFIVFNPCNGEPCLEDEKRCGLPINVWVTIIGYGVVWLVALSAVVLFCACNGKIV